MEEHYKKTVFNFSGDEKDRFNGIVQHYSEITNNIEDEIKAESSSVYGNAINYGPKSALLLKKRAFFCSENEENASITYDYRNKKVTPNGYSIKSRTDGGSHHLISWELRGSNDKQNWDILDVHNDEESLNGCGLSNTFLFDNKENKSYRYLQILQTDVSSAFHYYLTMSSLEFFGTVYE